MWKDCLDEYCIDIYDPVWCIIQIRHKMTVKDDYFGPGWLQNLILGEESQKN